MKKAYLTLRFTIENLALDVPDGKTEMQAYDEMMKDFCVTEFFESLVRDAAPHQICDVVHVESKLNQLN